ncbi:SPOR domain-containing protein [Actibacterium sp. 188UL27-1]|nr:SPOR domain-containing protein [Actibacterium sp. 188UL27-1]
MMGKASILRAVGMTTILLGVIGCEDGKFALGDKKPADGQATAAADRPSATSISGQETEAPEVFQQSEDGLWAGTPTFGGVWVAHPDVTAPERVLIRNEDNGQTVVGSLFKRERQNPGPRFQVSAEAANALTILAGSPTKLTVTALRREEVQPEPEAKADAEATIAPDARAIAEPAAIDSKPLEPLAAAAAGIEKAENKAKEAGDAVITPATTAAAGAASTEIQPLEDVQPELASASKPVSQLSKPYLQIGIFEVEEEATKAASELRKQGLVPILALKGEDGKTTWRVLVGPAENRAERASLRRKLRNLGYKRARFVAD